MPERFCSFISNKRAPDVRVHVGREHTIFPALCVDARVPMHKASQCASASPVERVRLLLAQYAGARQ